MWICDNCGAEFDEPEIEEESYENYYGVGSMFSNRHYFKLKTCPNCGSENIIETDDEGEF